MAESDSATGEPPISGRARLGRLAGGIVAHDEEGNVATAIRSLLGQRLPYGTVWNQVWVVASGCTDRTVDIVRSMAARDDRIRLIVEPTREGKARALDRVFDHATGDALVLLNADARAAPGSVDALVRTVAGVAPGDPFAVMGRPVPSDAARAGRWYACLDLLWEVHHRFHAGLDREGGGAHLSDELLMLSLPPPTRLPPGTINDGSYLGVWMARNGRVRRYAAEAVVLTDVPRRLVDHLAQRRRIHFGNSQVRQALGAAPSTLLRRSLADPRRSLELVVQLRRETRGAGRRFVFLGAVEAAAILLAWRDRFPGGSDHVRWRRIARTPSAEAATSTTPNPEANERTRSVIDVERRIRLVNGVAAAFGAPVADEELLGLLPADGPASEAELASWRKQHPRSDPPRVTDGTHLDSDPSALAARRARGGQYRERAAEFFRAAPTLLRAPVLCAAVSGSVAYGVPEEGDDVDLFVVVRAGAVWTFLATAFLEARRFDRRHGTRPPLCFNYVVDAPSARREFAHRQDLLFAREALSVRCLAGEPFFRSLLGSAPWIASMFPRLYAERTAEAPGPNVPAPAGPSVRLLNAVLFPWVATYLQLASLVRNRRFQRAGHRERCFRTVTRWGGLSVASDRFERIRTYYDDPSSLPPEVPGDGAATLSARRPEPSQG